VRAFQVLAAGIVFLLTAGPVSGADQPAPGEAAAPRSGPVLDGKIKHPQRLSVDVPAEQIEVSFQAGRGTEKSSYTGVLLWTLLGEAGGDRRPDLRRGTSPCHQITGRDGNVVIISTGEIAPDLRHPRSDHRPSPH
jgi:hypothetical protein